MLTIANKGLLLYRAELHRELDQLAQGAYLKRLVLDPDAGYATLEDESGRWIEVTDDEVPAERIQVCAVGCALTDPYELTAEPMRYTNSNWHNAMESDFGIPSQWAAMADTIFERWDRSDQLDEMVGWPTRFFEAIPAGVEFDSLAVNLIADACTHLADGYGLRNRERGDGPFAAANLFTHLITDQYGFESDPEGVLDAKHEARARSERVRDQLIADRKRAEVQRLRNQADALEAEMLNRLGEELAAENQPIPYIPTS